MDEPTSGALPGPLKTARAIMFVQGALGLLFGVLLLGAAGRLAREAREAVEAGEEAVRGGGFAFVLAVVYFALSIVLIVLAVRISRLQPGTRKWTIGIESVFAFFAILGLLGQARIGSVISLALAGTVLYVMFSGAGKAAFEPAGTGYRLDLREVPDLSDDEPR